MSRRGFTIIELLVVLSIIALLAGLGWPVLTALQARMASSRTLALVQSVAAGLAAYGADRIHLPGDANGPGPSRRLWDFNGDGLLDGDPRLDAAFTGAVRDEALLVAYRGPIAQAALDVPGRHRTKAGVVVDAWGEPLRIAFADALYGGRLGVWSCGPDRASGTTDDLTSWSVNHAR